MSTPEAAVSNDQPKEVDYVDINDPQFAEGEEISGFDDEKDPLEFTIVRDGVYNVEIDFAEQDASKRWAQRQDKNGGNYLSTRLAARILDGPFANRFVYDGFVSTMVFDGTCAVAKVLRAVGGEIKGARTSVELAKRLSQALPARARVKVSVRAQEADVKKPFYKSESQFPQKPDGTPDFQKVSLGEGPEHGGEVYVRSEITRYLEVE